jgi:glycosyltransferase involved in cell wall biosynthesis
MPKILFGISSSYCAHFMKGQVGYLSAHDFEVVIISGPGEEIEHLCKEEGAKLYTMDFSRALTPFRDLIALRRIITIIKKEKPDVVNAGNPKPGFLLTLACWITGHKACIFTMHGLVSDSRIGWSGTIIRFIEKLTCSLANKVLVVSPSLLSHAARTGVLKENKAVVIQNGSYNGIDIARFTRRESLVQDAEKIRARIPWKDAGTIFGFVGRVTKDKGIDLLLRSFDIVRSSYPRTKLIIAGPLDDENPVGRRELDRIKEDPSICYLGNMTDIVPVYLLFDVLVLSSYREGFGNVLIEAAAMELPVIAPKIPGCSDALDENVNGLMFTKGDEGSLAGAMIRYVSDTELRRQHGNAGRTFITRFNREKIWEGQRQLYLSLLNK